ncbi:hypothetical protein BC828DRAFT_405997 [Blastocladiella britannica]|nr:hypothetical protein BC828DRAFT_405997 [Blastocladiella britannica]
MHISILALLLLIGSTLVSALPVSSTTPSAIDPPGNMFASDATSTDVSPACAAAVSEVSSWANVTTCFGPYLSLFYATPANVCTGNCVNITVQAANVVAAACVQAVGGSSESNPSSAIATASDFQRAGIYQVWSNNKAAEIACATIPAPAVAAPTANAFLGFNFPTPTATEGAVAVSETGSAQAEDSGDGIVTVAGSLPTKTPTITTPASSTIAAADPSSQPPQYVIQSVISAYFGWQALVDPQGTGAPTTSAALTAEQRSVLRESQCTVINQAFWAAFVGNPLAAPSLYYWAIPNPTAYVQALQDLCGPDYFNIRACPTALSNVLSAVGNAVVTPTN